MKEFSLEGSRARMKIEDKVNSVPKSTNLNQVQNDLIQGGGG